LDGTSTSPGETLVGQVVSGRYRIDKLLGEGGMGAVYLAEHTLMRKRVALKLLHADMSKDEEILARFRREAEAAAHIEHPNVASATDFGQLDDGSFFLVLEYVEGPNLRSTIDEGAMPPARALHIARQIALGLERAHGSGIVHRDLKPENVMLVKKGDDPDFVKVLDFGIAKVEPSQRDTSQPLTRMGTILGTPEYMAPEQAMGEPVTPAADLYALGVILYEMLTAKHPFDAPDRMAVLSMHIVAPVPAMLDRNPALAPIPPPIEAITRRLLEKDSKLRHESARALVDAIDIAAAECGIELVFAAQSSPNLLAARISQPDLMAARISQHDLPPASQAWNASDALAKTDYGLPSPVVKPRASQLPPWLAPLERLPRSVLFAIAAAVPIVVLMFIVTLILARRSPTATTSEGGAAVAATEEAPPAPRPPTAKLAAAKAQGVTGLQALAQQYPQDVETHVELARALAAAKKTGDLLDELKVLAKLDKSALDDTLIAAVVAAAQAKDTADDAFALLEGPLGPKGVDALIDMSTSKTVAHVARARATKSIARPDVRANASPSTLVMLELKAAKSCTDKREQVERAKTVGDARVLPALKALRSPRGCGFLGIKDCWPCLRDDDIVDEAIRAVESRP
jgi:serine/threonine-protein kinase